MSHPNLQPMYYSCILCHPQRVIFNSRNALQAHLCWHHQSGIDRHRTSSGSYEDIVVKLTEHQLIAKRRKFQMKTASPAERRALQKIERKRIINILPRYVPSLFDQTGQSDDEQNSAESLGQTSHTADMTVCELTDNPNTKLVEKERKRSEGEASGDNKEDNPTTLMNLVYEASGTSSMMNTEIESHQEDSVVSLQPIDNEIDSTLLNTASSVNQEIDWFAEAEINELLPELGNTVGLNIVMPEIYRADTPIHDVIQETVEQQAEAVEIEEHYEEIPPPLMFADDKQEDDMKDGQTEREEDMTDRRQIINSIIARSHVDNVVCDNVHARSVKFSIPSINEQISALMQQISAETFVYPEVLIETLAGRIAMNSATLSNSEIGRLTRMSAIAQTNFAKSIITRLSRASIVTQDANVLLTSLLSEISAIADRQIE